MARLERLLRFLMTDPSASELAEYLVLAELTRPAPLACAIYMPDRTGVFVRAGQFGFEPWSLEEANDKWDILSSNLQGIRTLKSGTPVHMPIEILISEAEKAGYKTAWKTGVSSAWLIPLIGRVGPIGVIALYLPVASKSKLPPQEELLRFETLAAAVSTLIQGTEIRNFEGETEFPLMSPLTDRQLKIVAKVGKGASNAEIANQLDLSVGTVKLEISKILTELGATNRKDAVRKAMEKVPSASWRKN